ncbi:MAG TPA: hypothetical protein VE907_23575 [Gammaproteobacteria bacterium]|nr:hypothetical protein [Gammaproteobacteria bacterium]
MKAFCIFALSAFALPAFAQDAAPPASQPAAGVDEIVVPGRTGEQLRVEIERLENSVYERFNALNSDDDFDVHCFEQAPTGSNIPVRTCWPNFALHAEERAAGNSLRGMQGVGAGGNSQQERSDLARKGKEMIAEMQRVARQDEQLMKDLTQLAELKEQQQTGRPRRADR